MSNLPVYPDYKSQFMAEFFDPAKHQPTPGYISDEVAFEIARERWQQTMRHPFPISSFRSFKRHKNGK